MDISNGLVIMLLGIGGVFSILTIMFFFIKIVNFIDSRIKPRKLAILPSKENIIKKAGIMAALHHHKKKNRG